MRYHFGGTRLLQQRNDGFGSVDERTEFVVGEAFDEALFTWNGPVRSWRAAQAVELQADEPLTPTALQRLQAQLGSAPT